jgi:hypothetical protein
MEGNIITTSRPINVEGQYLEIEDKSREILSNAQPRLPPIDPKYMKDKKKAGQKKSRYGSVGGLDEIEKI